MSREDLFERIFSSHNSDDQPLFDDRDRLVGAFIYDVACEVFQTSPTDSNDEPPDGDDDNDDSDSDSSFEEKVEATKENFERILELFKLTRKAKRKFLRNFEQWAPICIRHIKVLKETAETIHSDKFNSDIAKLVGIVVAALGGIACAVSLFTPLAAVTVPLAVGGGVGCGLGGTVLLGTNLTQMVLLKKQLDEAKRTIKDHEDKFSLMAHWFTIPEELKRPLESVVSLGVLKEIGDDLKHFFDEVTRETGITIGEFKMRFKEVLKLSFQKMNKSGKLTADFGDVFTPIVVTFMFLVCVMKGKNRLILDCIMINANLALALLNISVPASQLANGLARGASELGDDIMALALSKFLVVANLAIDLLSMIITSIEIHKRVEPRQTKELKEVAAQLEKMFLAIENVYSATKKHESDVAEKWTTIILHSVPDDAEQEDIKMAVRSHLPDKAWFCIKLEKLKTKGNNWLVNVPSSHSEQLLLQSHLIVKEQRCEVKE